MTTVRITYLVRPYAGHPPTVLFKTAVPPRHLDRVLARYADHVRRQFGSTTTRELVPRRLDDGSYEVWKRQRPGGLLLATITLAP